MDANNRNRSGNRSGRRDALALALAAGKTIKQAAETAGVSERTAQSWWADPDFRARVGELRGRVVSRALGRMTNGLTAAANTLRKLLKSGNDTVRLGAAKALVELSLKVRDATDLQAFLLRMVAEIKETKEEISETKSRYGQAHSGDENERPRNAHAFGDDPAGRAKDVPPPD